MNAGFQGWGHRSGFRRRGLLPPVLRAMLIANFGVYIAQFGLMFAAPELGYWLFHPTAGLLPLKTNLNPARAEMFGLFEPWQLVTYMFLHGGFFHLAFNMFALWMFGVEVEETWGSQRFLVYYFLCGIGGGALQIALPLLLQTSQVSLPFFGSPEMYLPKPVVGASGAVYGVLLAFGLTFPTRIVLIPPMIPVPAKLLVVIYAVISIFGGLSGGGQVAHFAHLGGMAFGYGYIRWQIHRRRFIRR